MSISIIVATTIDNAIGQDGDLIHRDPTDMKHFQDLTTGHVVIMGRKTYESLPNGPLPNRVNYVVSSTMDTKNKDCIVLLSLEEAIRWAKHDHPDKEIFIIGGGQIYREALDKDLVDIIYMTKFVCYAPYADTYFPPLTIEWKLVDYKAKLSNPLAEDTFIPTFFQTWRKK